jgi:serine/threonine protein kinase
MNDLSGSSFGRYHLVEKLGEGGMAVVYKAFDTRLECDVAVKIIRMDNLPRSSEEVALKRFEREAKAVAQLTHPNIVKVMDFGEENGLPYLVMPFLPGGTLKQYLGSPMPYAEAAHLLQPVADALAYAHLHNVVHRDVKPSNILITELGQPMLTDFGIAKIMDLQDGQTLTGTGVGIGTPEYMAPEQWTGKITPSVDIYSLGVVFYELVTGHKPYTADTPAAILLKQANDPLPKPSKFVPGLPAQVEQVLFTALAKKPENRYTSIEKFEMSLMELGAASIPRKRIPASSVEKNNNEAPNSSLITNLETPLVIKNGKKEVKLAEAGPNKGEKGNKFKLGICFGLVATLILVGLLTFKNSLFPSKTTPASIMASTLPTNISELTLTPTFNPTVTIELPPILSATVVQIANLQGITKNDIYCRTGSSMDYSITGLLEADTELTVVGINNDWLLVSEPLNCWLPESSVTISPEVTMLPQATPPALLPDLVFSTSIRYERNKNSLCMIIKNIGYMESGSFDVKFINISDSVYLQFTSIDPGNFQQQCITYHWPDWGSACKSYGIIDPENKIRELNEGNNHGSLC